MAAPLFRLQARSLFLTYPQVPDTWTSEKVLDTARLVLQGKGYEIVKWCVARELHKDGGIHFHAYFDMDKRVRLRGAHCLDLEIGGTKQHGNYKAANKGTVKYIQKFGDYITNIGEVEDYLALARRGDAVAATDLYLDTHARDAMITGRARVLQNAMQLGPPRVQGQKMGPFGHSLWLAVNGWDRALQALLLWGPTGSMKTSFAKHLLPGALFVREVNQLKELTPEHVGIIFDDMAFEGEKRETVLHLLDLENDSHIRVLYQSTRIPAGTPRIFTSNKPALYTFGRWDDALARRTYIANIS